MVSSLGLFPIGVGSNPTFNTMTNPNNINNEKIVDNNLKEKKFIEERSEEQKIRDQKLLDKKMTVEFDVKLAAIVFIVIIFITTYAIIMASSYLSRRPIGRG